MSTRPIVFHHPPTTSPSDRGQKVNLFANKYITFAFGVTLILTYTGIACSPAPQTPTVVASASTVVQAPPPHFDCDDSIAHQGPISSIAFAKNGEFLLSSAGDTIVWALNSKLPHKKVSGGKALATSPDGNYFVHDQNGKLRMAALPSGDTIRMLEGHSKGVLSISFFPNSKQIATSGSDEIVRTWSLESAAALSGGRVAGGANTVAVCPDGKCIISAGKQSIDVWSPDGEQPFRSFKRNLYDVQNIIISKDGKMLVTSSKTSPESEEWLVRLWSFPQLRLQKTIIRPDARTEIESPAAKPGAPKKKLFKDIPVSAIALSNDAKTLAIATGKVIELWDTTTTKRKSILGQHKGTVTALTFGPNDDVIASGAANDVIRLWPLNGSSSTCLFDEEATLMTRKTISNAAVTE